MDFHRVLKRLRLSFVRADFGPATISSTSNEKYLSRAVLIRDVQLSCFNIPLVTLGGVSNNFLYARSANNLGTSSVPAAHVANKLVLERATLDSLIL
jgi:hypothetical protein